MEKFYTCDEIAERYGVKRTTVWAWLRASLIPSYRFGKALRVKESDLLAFEESRMTAKASKE